MKKVLGLVLLLWSSLANAQVMTDPALQGAVTTALDAIYGYEFAEADQAIRQIRSRFPQHPVGPILLATKLQWQHMPLRGNAAATAQFVQAANQALALAQKRLAQHKQDPEGTFFALTAHSYLALRYNYDNEQMKAVNESRKLYGYMKDGFKLMSQNPDFFFTTGLYNYYVERYPLDHPAVKPMMLFFQNGDMAQGLKQLDVAAKRGVFTRTAGQYYLSHIYLEHESQPGRAVNYAQWLVERYPNNPIFTMRLAEALLLAGRSDEAVTYVNRLKTSGHKLTAMPVQVFEGLLHEQQRKDDGAAARFYQAALKMPADAFYTREFHAMAHAGLARIAARANDRSLARTHYKKTLDLAEYKSLIREAKAYLKA